MSYPDLSDLRQRVRDLLNESGTTFYSNACLNRFINDGQRDVAIKALCYESAQSLTTATNTRTIAVTCIKTFGVEYVPASGTRLGLGLITPRMVGHMRLTGITPQYWFPWAGNICIEPIPQTAYNLVVYTAILPTVDLSSDTDKPVLPNEFIPWIVQFAFIRGLIRDKKYASAAMIYKVYIDAMKIARDNMMKKYADARTDFEIPDAIEGVGK